MWQDEAEGCMRQMTQSEALIIHAIIAKVNYIVLLCKMTQIAG